MEGEIKNMTTHMYLTSISIHSIDYPGTCSPSFFLLIQEKHFKIEPLCKLDNARNAHVTRAFHIYKNYL